MAEGQIGRVGAAAALVRTDRGVSSRAATLPVSDSIIAARLSSGAGARVPDQRPYIVAVRTPARGGATKEQNLAGSVPNADRTASAQTGSSSSDVIPHETGRTVGSPPSADSGQQRIPSEQETAPRSGDTVFPGRPDRTGADAGRGDGGKGSGGKPPIGPGNEPGEMPDSGGERRQRNEDEQRAEALQVVRRDALERFAAHAWPQNEKRVATRAIKQLFGVPDRAATDTSPKAQRDFESWQEAGLKLHQEEALTKTGSPLPLALTFESLAETVAAEKIDYIPELGKGSQDFLGAFVAHRRELIEHNQRALLERGRIAETERKLEEIDAETDPLAGTKRAEAIGELVAHSIGHVEAQRSFTRKDGFGEHSTAEIRQQENTDIFLHALLPTDSRLGDMTQQQKNVFVNRLLFDYSLNDGHSMHSIDGSGRLTEEGWKRHDNLAIAKMYFEGKNTDEIRVGPTANRQRRVASALSDIATWAYKTRLFTYRAIDMGQYPSLLVSEVLPPPKRPSPKDFAEIYSEGIREAAERVAAGREFAAEVRSEVATALLDVPFRGGHYIETTVEEGKVVMHTYRSSEGHSYWRQPADATSSERHQAGLREGWGTITITADEPRPAKVDQREKDKIVDKYEYSLVKPGQLSAEKHYHELAAIFGITPGELQELAKSTDGTGRYITSPARIKAALASTVDLDQPVIIAQTHIGIGTIRTTKTEILGSLSSENAHYQRLQKLTEKINSGEIAREQETRRAHAEHYSREDLEADKQKIAPIAGSTPIGDIMGINNLIRAVGTEYYSHILGHRGILVYDGEPNRYIARDVREGKITLDEIPALYFRADVAGLPGRPDNFKAEVIDTPMDQLPVPTDVIRPGSLTTIQVSADLVGPDGEVQEQTARAYTLYMLREGTGAGIARVSDDYDPRLRLNAPYEAGKLLRIISYPLESQLTSPLYITETGESNPLSGEVVHHLQEVAVRGSVQMNDPRHGALHGTSYEAIRSLIDSGVLTGSHATDTTSQSSLRGLSVYPTTQLLGALTHLDAPLMRAQLEDEPQESSEYASGYAKSIGQRHRFLTELGIPLTDREADQNANSLFGWIDADEELFERHRAYFLRRGFSPDAIRSAIEQSVGRKGFLLGISPEVARTAGITFTEGDGEDITIQMQGDGLPYELISGIQPLGEAEKEQLKSLLGQGFSS